MSLISFTDENGNQVSPDSKYVPVQGGVVKGQITYIGPALDQEGNPISGRGLLTIKQSNGAEFRTMLFDPNNSSNQLVAKGIFNRFMLHLCSKVLTDAEIVDLDNKAQDNFDELFKLLHTIVEPKFKDVDIFHRVVFEQSKKDGKMYPRLGKKGDWIELCTGDKATRLAYSEGPNETFSPVAKMVEAPVNSAANPFE